MKYVELISESFEQLQTLEKKQPLVRNEKRVRFLKFLKNGAAKTQKEAGAKVSWKARQSQKIWQMYREGGLAAVLKKTEKRGFGKLTAIEISGLNRYLAEFGGRTLAEIQQYLQAAFGISYSIGGLSDLCIRLRIKLKTARPNNYQKNEAEVLLDKKTLLF